MVDYKLKYLELSGGTRPRQRPKILDPNDDESTDIPSVIPPPPKAANTLASANANCYC
jgi:hypothetical protein